MTSPCTGNFWRPVLPISVNQSWGSQTRIYEVLIANRVFYSMRDELKPVYFHQVSKNPASPITFYRHPDPPRPRDIPVDRQSTRLTAMHDDQRFRPRELIDKLSFGPRDQISVSWAEFVLLLYRIKEIIHNHTGSLIKILRIYIARITYKLIVKIRRNYIISMGRGCPVYPDQHHFSWTSNRLKINPKDNFPLGQVVLGTISQTNTFRVTIPS